MVATNGGTGSLSGPLPAHFLQAFLLLRLATAPEDLAYGPAVEPGLGEEVGGVVGFVAVIGVVVEFGHRRLRGLRPAIRPKDHPPTLPGIRPETAFLRLRDGTAQARPCAGGNRRAITNRPGPGYAAAVREGV